MSDEDIDVVDPYADCNTSDEYEPNVSESSNDNKVLPKKAKRLKNSEVNESTQDDQLESDESEQEDDENSVSNLNWDTVDESKLKKLDFEVEEVGIKPSIMQNIIVLYFFKLFVTDEIIVYIAEQTNIYAQQKLAQQPMNPKR
ncbi:hypothetical protein HHI36_007331 [Cryptolaemus montrouzieri]|uniref:Uncharacterized protein n=1 Tax=Cryptolaemus montrouzieri TaxID=559131 RepID=A0ABD2MP87_9CUCU